MAQPDEERARRRRGLVDPGLLAERFAAALQNGLEVARFGGLGAKAEPSPYEIAAEGLHHRLRHYFPDGGASGRPAVLLIPPLMLTAEVWDVAPDASGVAILHETGSDPWVIDFGSPEDEEGGLERTLTDHVVAVSDAIEQVRKATGQDVHVMGYSQGGMFAYQAAAYRRSEGLASLVTFGSPVDMHQQLPIDLPSEMIADAIDRLGKLQSSLLPDGIPSWATRLGFQLMDPVKTIRQRIDFAMKLYDREALQPREDTRRFLENDGWVAFPGPALRDVMDQLIAHNRLLQGGFVIDGQTVTLADIVCPILAFVGDTDSIAPPPTVRAIRVAAPRADSYQIRIPAGHFGLVVGSRSTEMVWPAVAEWLAWQNGDGPMPERAKPIEARAPRDSESPSTVEEIGRRAELAWTLGRDMLGDVASLLENRVGVLGRLSTTIAPQIPRLNRLAELRSDTPISMGRSLARQAEDAPDDTFFLFEGRAHNYKAANERVDNVVRGLIECGVRHGQYVGVLMHTRPSAATATVALSRMGAVTVLLSPDASLSAQLEQVPIDHLVADPEHAETARELFGRDVLVLGGGGETRRLADGLIDMEAIDPNRVELPEWYTPDAAVAGELALVLITGDGERIGVNRVTNRRWATSAYGTATACALSSGDTVYCCSPIHHATGILVCVGGALVSGARLAMATHFEPRIFWEDVRRYGVNVVFYAGTLCRLLVNAPENRAELHHPLRLFAGSGMPKSIWNRVVERFAPAQVVEFFASTEGNAVLVNLTGEKVGSVGAPLPGGAELAVAAWDLEAGRIITDDSGFAERCAPGDTGLLLAEFDVGRGEVDRRPLRGVFEPGDAWIDTGDLVKQDHDGDYWLIDTVADLVHSASGAVPTVPVEDVLAEALPFIDLVAVIGVKIRGLRHEVPAAALTLRPGAKFDPVALRRCVERELPRAQRPVIVRVVKQLPLTAGHRVRKSVLRRRGIGPGAKTGKGYWMAPGEATYLPLPDDAAELAEALGGGKDA